MRVHADRDDKAWPPSHRRSAARRPRWFPRRGRRPRRAPGPGPGPGRGTAVRVGVHDDLGTALQRVVGHRVHVAHDQVGPVAGSLAGHRRRRRPRSWPVRSPDVRAERGDVLAVVGSRADDQHVAGLPASSAVPASPTPSISRLFLAPKYSRVLLANASISARHAVLRFGHRRGHRRGVLPPALGHDLIRPRTGCPPSSRHDLPLFYPVEHLGPASSISGMPAFDRSPARGSDSGRRCSAPRSRPRRRDGPRGRRHWSGRGPRGRRWRYHRARPPLGEVLGPAVKARSRRYTG